MSEVDRHVVCTNTVLIREQDCSLIHERAVREAQDLLSYNRYFLINEILSYN